MHVEMYIAGICMQILNLNTKLFNLRKNNKMSKEQYKLIMYYVISVALMSNQEYNISREI